MSTEFDKEIDSLLREGARRREHAAFSERGARRAEARADDGVDVTSSAAHLDADELNAYAENALPAATRNAYTAHLADCDDCRRTVTQLALAAGIPAQLEQQANTATAERKNLPNITWRERIGALFAPRAWRYAVPALALLLVSAVALMGWLRSSQKEASLAQRNTTETQKAAIPQPETHHAPQNNNAPLATSEERAAIAVNSNTPAAREEVAASNARQGEEQPQAGVVARDAPPPPALASSAGAAASSSADMSAPQPTPVTVAETVTVAPEQDSKAKKVAEPAEETAKDVQKPGNFENRQQRERISGPHRNEQSRNARTVNNNDDSRDRADKTDDNLATAARSTAPPASAAKRAEPRNTDREKDENKPSDNAVKNEGRRKKEQPEVETRAIAGRMFRRQGDTWIDTAYNSTQAVTVVRRNSEQYRALSADEPTLRRIADALGGEVTVVWKGRAYRFR